MVFSNVMVDITISCDSFVFRSDCASPCNEGLRKLQVIDTFLLAAIDCVTYLFSLFTLILIVFV